MFNAANVTLINLFIITHLLFTLLARCACVFVYIKLFFRWLPKGIRIKQINMHCKVKENATETFGWESNKYNKSTHNIDSSCDIPNAYHINQSRNKTSSVMKRHKAIMNKTENTNTSVPLNDKNVEPTTARAGIRVSRSNFHNKLSGCSKQRTKFEKIKSAIYICVRCHADFSTFDALNNHLQLPDSCQKPLVLCPICNKTFASISNRNTHLNTHKEKLRHACTECGKEFSTAIALQVHLEYFHTEYFDATPSGFSCKLCAEVGRTKQAILQHINKNHLHVTTFLCDKCGKCFWNKSSLKAHVSIHSDVKAFMCQICSKAFKLKSSLRAHIRTHSQERKFVCDECGKTFKKHFTLTEHKKVHAGFFPFLCNVCNKAFVSKSSCNAHVKNHKSE